MSKYKLTIDKSSKTRPSNVSQINKLFCQSCDRLIIEWLLDGEHIVPTCSECSEDGKPTDAYLVAPKPQKGGEQNG